MKLFEWIGCLMAFACLIEFASNPKKALLDIQRGPAPNLAAFDTMLNHPPRRKAHKRHKVISTSALKVSAE